MLALILIMLWSLLTGCDLGVVTNKSNKTVSLPSFTVTPFEYAGVQASTALYVDAIDCQTELAQSNTAEDELADAFEENDNAKPVALAMSAKVYADTVFYDCNIRQQFNEDGGEEVEDTSEYKLYHAGKIASEPTDDTPLRTRFVAWKEFKDNDGSIPKTAGEADKIAGSLTNLYAFATDKDNSASDQKTRINLDKNESIRQLDVSMYSTHTFKPETKDDDVVLVGRGFIVEHKSGSDKEHLLSTRFLDYDQEVIHLLLAHFKAEGSALLTAECEIDDDEDYNKSCAGVEYEVSYYNKATEKMEDDVPAGFKKTREDFLTNLTTNWTHGSYLADKLDPEVEFFSGTGTTDAKRQEFFTADLPKQQ